MNISLREMLLPLVGDSQPPQAACAALCAAQGRAGGLSWQGRSPPPPLSTYPPPRGRVPSDSEAGGGGKRSTKCKCAVAVPAGVT